MRIGKLNELGGMAQKRAVIYARQSMEHQDGSCDRQIVLAKQLAERHGWEVVRVYSDEGVGRREFERRPQFKRMLADASAGTFEVVICRDNTRLGGDTSRVMRAIEDLKEDGVSVWYYLDDQEQKMESWTDKVMFAMKSGAAEGERDAISSRTREALVMKAQQGLCVGGRCHGYDLIPILEGSVKKRTEYAINPMEAAIVREIFERKAKGEGLRTICHDLNARGIPSPRTGAGVWTPGTLKPMLERVRYIGSLEYGHKRKVYKRGTKQRISAEPDVAIKRPDLAIVDMKTWNAVQHQFRHQARLTGRAGPRAPTKTMLGGLMKCGVCGGSVSAERQGWGSPDRGGRRHGKMVYRCKRRRDSGASTCSNSAARPVEIVDDLVLKWLVRDVLSSRDLVEACIADIRKALREQQKTYGVDIKEWERHIKRARAELDKLGASLLASDAKPALVLKMIADREEKVADLDAKIKRAKVSPKVVDMEIRRMEKEAIYRLRNMGQMMKESPAGARQAIETMLDGPLIVTPTSDGRFKLTGRVSISECDPIELEEGAPARPYGRAGLEKAVSGLSGRQHPQGESSGGTRDHLYRRGRPYVDEFRTALLAITREAA